MRNVLWILVSAGLVAPGAGSPPATAAPVRLASRTIDPSGSTRDAVTALARAAARPEGAHLLVQLSRPVDAPLRDAFAASGVALLRYVPDATWVASVASGAEPPAALRSLITWAAELEPADKIAASLRRERLPAWAIADDGQLVVRARFHDDVTREAGARAIAAAGARVLEPMALFSGVVASISPERLEDLAALDVVLWIEERLPAPSPENDGVRARIGANDVASAPHALTGAGVNVGVWDAGAIASHDDFTGRLTLVQGSPVSTHATHVAGTLAGSGALSAASGGAEKQWRGIAPGAALYSWDTGGNIIAEIQSGVTTFGFTVENNSWGFPVDGTNCDDYGDYRLLAPEFDALVRGSSGSPLTVVFSAGNERNDGDCPLADGAYANLTPPKAAKNVLVVGATNSDDDTMTDFSSFGPVDDGRLKPDLTAPGCEAGGEGYVRSTLPGDVYGGPSWCGTSMAAAATSGAIALLHELHAGLVGSGAPLPASTKALLVATAEDLGNPGPDYAFGHGRLDVRRAADERVDATQLVLSVTQGATQTVAFEVPPSSPPLRVAIAWDDPDALPLADPALINDLDLVLRDPLGGAHLPWVLDPAQPAADAVRAVDALNNVEHVTVDAPMAGSWTAEITGALVPEGPQVVAMAGLDLEAPGPVSALTVVGTAPTSIDLTWELPAASDVEGTLLVRAETPDAWGGPATGDEYVPGQIVAPDAVVVVASGADHSQSPFSDTGLAEGTLYYYDAYAYDEMRNYSLVASTLGIAGGAVDVEAQGPATALVLAPPTPNPTRTGARIRFSLEAAGPVRVDLFDAGGRHVRTLVRDHLQAARYAVRWDGRDAAGRAVAPGVYFVALEADGRRLTQRITRLD